MSEPIEKIVDYFDYANAYISACKSLYKLHYAGKAVSDFSDYKDRVFRVGPFYQNLGQAVELTFKATLLLSGHSTRQLRKLSHNLEELLKELRKNVDLSNVEDRAFEAATLAGPPAGLLKRIEETGQPPVAWYLFATHIRSLNSNYSLFELPDGEKSSDKFRSRYPSNDRTYRDVCVEAVIAGLDALMDKNQRELNRKILERNA